jgi:predicted nucleic acid-binding protein
MRNRRAYLGHRVASGTATTFVKNVNVDSGFLIGLFDETDPLHSRCRDFLKNYRGRFLTTEAVITETMALLSTRQQWRCLEWLGSASQAGLLQVDREPLDFRSIEKLARKYADQPMDFADASVVLLAMRSGIREILTADRRDFAVYRIGGRTRFVDVLAEKL